MWKDYSRTKKLADQLERIVSGKNQGCSWGCLKGALSKDHITITQTQKYWSIKLDAEKANTSEIRYLQIEI